MKRLVFMFVVAAVLAAAAPVRAQNTLQGSWFISPSGHPDRVRLELRMGDSDGSRHDDESTDTMSLAELGLTQAQLDRTGSPLDFTLKRQAGQIAFKGAASEGTGFGHFVFTADPQYVQEVQRRGYSVDSPHMLLAATMLDITTSYMDSIAAAGFTNVGFGKLIAYRALGIDAPYIQSMRRQFAGIDEGNIISLKALKVDSSYINEMASVGYSHLTASQLIEMRAMGIDAAFVRRAQAHGFNNLSVEKLVQAKALGVI